ncbi:hypothetical protein P3L10_001246 [Capsicum annuum]
MVIMALIMRPCWITHPHTSLVRAPTITLNPMDQDTIFVVWNTRRVNNEDFKRNFKELIRNRNPCLVALLETKMSKSYLFKGNLLLMIILSFLSLVIQREWNKYGTLMFSKLLLKIASIRRFML